MIVNLYILAISKDFSVEVTYDNIVGEESCPINTSKKKSIPETFYESLFITYKNATMETFYSPEVQYSKVATLKDPTREQIYEKVQEILDDFHPDNYPELFL